MKSSLNMIDLYALDCVRIHPRDDDCPECQGVGEVEGDAVCCNGYYSVLMDCPRCKGSGKIDIELPEEE